MKLRVIVKKNRTPHLLKALREQMPQLIVQTSEFIAKNAVAFAPIAPPEYEHAGYLKGGIKAEPLRSLKSRIICTASFGRFVEWGTIYMAPRPFMKQGAATGLPFIFIRMDQMIAEAIK